MQPVIVVLLDPYDAGRHHWVLGGEIPDRAALVECRTAHLGRQRWQFGRWAPCADCLQDGILAARQVGVL